MMAFAGMKSILIADDEPGIRELAKRAFAAAGHPTFEAGNGHEAIKVMERAHIDLAVMDIIMPGKEGVETILEIKTRWPDCKVLAISGGGRIAAQDFLDLARHVGADDTLRKPFKFNELVEMARKLLDAPKVAPIAEAV